MNTRALTYIAIALAVFFFAGTASAEMLILEGGTDGEFEISQRRIFTLPGRNLSKLTFRYANPAGVDTDTLVQRIRGRRVKYSPRPESVTDERDRFGNTYTVVTWRGLTTEAVVDESYTIELNTRLTGAVSRAPYPLPRLDIPGKAAMYLEPTEQVEVRDPEIARLAKGLTKGVETEQAAVTAILNWVVDNIKYKTPIPEYGAVWTLSTRTGNCQNFSHLSMALLRASGIPARIVGGISLGRPWKVPIEGGSLLQTIGQGGHAWIEVWYPDLGWLPYDAQQSHLFVGPRHIKQTVGLDSRDVNDSWRAAPALPPFREDISADFPRDRVSLTLKESVPGPASYIMTASIAPSMAAPSVVAPAVVAAKPAPPPVAPRPVPPPPPPIVDKAAPPPPVVEPPELAPPVVEPPPVSPAPKPALVPPGPQPIVIGNLDFPSLMDFYVKILDKEVGEKTFDKETAEYVTGRTVYAQRFRVEDRMAMQTVSLAMHKFGGRIGGLWVDVVEDSGGRPGFSGHRSLPVSLDQVRYAPGYRWFDFRFSRATEDSPVLEPGLYWIVLRHTRDAVVSWFYSPANRYGTADDTRSTGSGKGFSDVLNLDFNFRVTGLELP